MHNVRVVSQVSLGENEDHSLGKSMSDSSETLLQRGRGGRSICKILVKGSSMPSIEGEEEVQCLLYKMFSASHEQLMSHEGI